MCIKNGLQFDVKPNSCSLCEALKESLIWGDVVVLKNGVHENWALCISKEEKIVKNEKTGEEEKLIKINVAVFSSKGVKCLSLEDAVENSEAATYYRCCQTDSCLCRKQSVKRAKRAIAATANNVAQPVDRAMDAIDLRGIPIDDADEALTEVVARFLPDRYNVLNNNDESFCYYCVHGEPYTSVGIKATRYGIVPASVAGGGAAGGAGIGFGIGLLGGPLAPITIPVGMGIGAAIGATVGLLSSLIGGAVHHGTLYQGLQCDCKKKVTKKRSFWDLRRN